MGETASLLSVIIIYQKKKAIKHKRNLIWFTNKIANAEFYTPPKIKLNIKPVLELILQTRDATRVEHMERFFASDIH